MTPVERAQAAAAAALKRVAGKRAVYARGPLRVSVVAVPGRTDAELVDQDNLSTRASSDDWLIDVADLVLGGSPTEPKARDTITVDGVTYTAFAIPPEGVWRFSGQGRRRFRIHTRSTSP